MNHPVYHNGPNHCWGFPLIGQVGTSKKKICIYQLKCVFRIFFLVCHSKI